MSELVIKASKRSGELFQDYKRMILVWPPQLNKEIHWIMCNSMRSSLVRIPSSEDDKREPMPSIATFNCCKSFICFLGVEYTGETIIGSSGWVL